MKPGSSPRRRYDYRRRRSLAAGVVLSVAAALLLGIYIGRAAVYAEMRSDSNSLVSLQDHVVSMQVELQQFRDELEVARARHEVDRQALELVRKEITAQRSRAGDLEEDVRFYQSLMAPEGADEGVILRTPELVPGSRTDRIAYQIVIQQRARRHDMVEGNLSVQVFGQSANREQSFSLAELSDDIDQDIIKLDFRYFQAITGELTLPEGFRPMGLSLVATVVAPREMEVREQFAWQLQEQFTNIGQK